MRVLFLVYLAAVLLVLPARAQESEPSSSEPQTFVFVHGAWGGGHDYRPMEEILEAQGHTVYRPTLTGLGRRVHLGGPDVNLSTHIEDIVNVLTFEQLEDVVLVGHSYGGMVATGVAHRVPERIKRLVYVDAFLPEHGESLFSLTGEENAAQSRRVAEQGDGWSIPPFWPDPWPDVPHPLATLEEAVAANHPDAAAIPGTYILTIDPGADTDGFSHFAERAEARGWPVHVLRTDHNPQRSMPNELAALLVQAAQNE